MKILALILLSIVLSAAGQVLLKAGLLAESASLALPWQNPMAWRRVIVCPHILLGLSAWAGATLVWLLVLSRAPLGYAYCLTSVTYILVPLASWALFKETMCWQHVLGMAVIVVGVILVVSARQNGGEYVYP